MLNTGYATYGREVLSRLYNSGKYELGEHASYIEHNDPRIQNLPWTVYANLPDSNSEEDKNNYLSKPSNQFGEWRFDDICIDMKPHIVMDIRDFWMCSHEYRSPLRPYYNWAIMPTVDAYPQNEEWLCTYADADGVFTYQDWSKNILDHEGGGRIKTLGAASPAAAPEFVPLDQEAIKNHMGLNDKMIIGTVMRNQRRKLFPDLFASFRFLLDETGREDVLLYCHTSYPDMGWDLPKLLLQYNLTSKVLFTYKCKDCKHIFPNYFNDVITDCPKCGNLSASFVSVQEGASNKDLSVIYSLFDIYVQYANSEGFGMPQLEAAACGVPVVAVDYSAMSDAIRKLGGEPIPLAALSLELETGCFRAVPDNNSLIKYLTGFIGLDIEVRQNMRVAARQAYLKHYNWDVTAQRWGQYFDNVDIDIYEKKWISEPKYINIPSEYPDRISNKDFARWLIVNLLQEPRFINSYMEARLIKDLNYSVTTPGLSGMYFNDDSASPMFHKVNWQPFSRDIAFNHFCELAKRKNHWENKRWQSVKK